MEKIVLNERQKQVLQLMLIEKKDKFNYTDEEMKIGSEVIDMADAMRIELSAVEETGDNLMVWFWGKYLKQEGLYKIDNTSKIKFNKKQKSILNAASNGNYMAAFQNEKTNEDYFVVISQVCSYIAETNAYKELNNSYCHYLKWFWNKYKKQEGI
jgi:hypothetical protein